MDGKKVAIGVLVVLAVLLGGLVANGLRRENVAYGQASVFSTYLATAVEIREDVASFAILDTNTRRLIFYDLAPPKYELRPMGGVALTKDFPAHK